jgi:ankyrin repeat protein
MTETLVKAGANVNRIEKFHNQTPLIYAPAGGHIGIVKLLLSRDADVRPRAPLATGACGRQAAQNAAPATAQNAPAAPEAVRKADTTRPSILPSRRCH